MIKPTVGRIVYYYGRDKSPGPDIPGPFAAIVTAVRGDRMVDLTVFTPSNFPAVRDKVHLVQEDDKPQDRGDYCTWMPYQTEQAKKNEKWDRILAEAPVVDLTEPVAPDKDNPVPPKTPETPETPDPATATDAEWDAPPPKKGKKNADGG